MSIEKVAIAKFYSVPQSPIEVAQNRREISLTANQTYLYRRCMETRSRAVWRLHTSTGCVREVPAGSRSVWIPHQNLVYRLRDPVQSFVETVHNTSRTNVLSMDICAQLKRFLFLIPLSFFLTDATILHQYYTRVENGENLAGSVGSECKTKSLLQCSARYVGPVT